MIKKLAILGMLAAAVVVPTLASAQSVSLHGFADVSYKNDYITPRGLHVTAAGDTVQALDGLVLDFPLDPKGALTDFSLVAGTWTDWNPGFDPARNSEGFNEFDWFLGGAVKVGSNVKLGAQYVEFISPQKAFRTERNMEFSAAFDDGAYFKGFSFQPYVKLFYAMSGDSTVVLGKHGGTYDIELGAGPNIDLHAYNIPLTLSAPTWITFGPTDFWGGGGNTGVFSTGLKATYPLSLPAAAGHWSVYGSYQYYDLINSQLVKAQTLLTGKTGRDNSVFTVGIGLGF